MVKIPLFTGFYTSQLAQDFFHQQYSVSNMWKDFQFHFSSWLGLIQLKQPTFYFLWWTLPSLKLTVRTWQEAWPQKETHLLTLVFQVRAVSFREGIVDVSGSRMIRYIQDFAHASSTSFCFCSASRRACSLGKNVKEAQMFLYNLGNLL